MAYILTVSVSCVFYVWHQRLEVMASNVKARASTCKSKDVEAERSEGVGLRLPYSAAPLPYLPDYQCHTKATFSLIIWSWLWEPSLVQGCNVQSHISIMAARATARPGLL